MALRRSASAIFTRLNSAPARRLQHSAIHTETPTHLKDGEDALKTMRMIVEEQTFAPQLVEIAHANMMAAAKKLAFAFFTQGSNHERAKNDAKKHETVDTKCSVTRTTNTPRPGSSSAAP